MKDLQLEIAQYMKERNWHKQHPSDVAKSISIEAAELLEIFQWVDLTASETKRDKIRMEKVKGELADVLIYCIEMLALLDLDGPEIIRKKLKLAAKKYPAALMRKTVDLRKGSQGSIYLKIKEKYRRKALS
jgi:NTP pyrophosphatase (non-canonical NTP hydrolase)